MQVHGAAEALPVRRVPAVCEGDGESDRQEVEEGGKVKGALSAEPSRAEPSRAEPSRAEPVDRCKRVPHAAIGDALAFAYRPLPFHARTHSQAYRAPGGPPRASLCGCKVSVVAAYKQLLLDAAVAPGDSFAEFARKHGEDARCAPNTRRVPPMGTMPL